MTIEVTLLLLDVIRPLTSAKTPFLSVESAQHVTLKSLGLDSLDTLKLAMDLEDALNIDIEIVDFPDTLTLSAFAERLTAMKSKSHKNLDVPMTLRS